MEVVEEAGGTPYIPFKSNTVVPKDDGIWGKMYHLFMFNREEFMRHYHKRSNAESVFSMVKGKFGDSVRSKSDVGQINEVLAKMLCHNMCVLIRATHELGVEPIFASGSGVEPKLFL
jgi:transposase